MEVDALIGHERFDEVLGAGTVLRRVVLLEIGEEPVKVPVHVLVDHELRRVELVRDPVEALRDVDDLFRVVGLHRFLEEVGPDVLDLLAGPFEELLVIELFHRDMDDLLPLQDLSGPAQLDEFPQGEGHLGREPHHLIARDPRADLEGLDLPEVEKHPQLTVRSLSFPEAAVGEDRAGGESHGKRRDVGEGVFRPGLEVFHAVDEGGVVHLVHGRVLEREAQGLDEPKERLILGHVG